MQKGEVRLNWTENMNELAKEIASFLPFKYFFLNDKEIKHGIFLLLLCKTSNLNSLCVLLGDCEAELELYYEDR